MANKKAFQDEVKNKNRRARKDQRKKKKKTEGGFFHSIATIVSSKVFRSFLTIVIAALIGGAGTYLWMNSRPSQETVLVRMKGKTITVADLYESSKETDETKSALLQEIFSTMLEDKYGSKVSEKTVNQRYEQYSKQYGSSLTTLLSQNGMTTESFKKSLRVQLLQEYAYKAAAKKELTDKKLQSLYKDYTPDVTVKVIETDDKDKADSLHSQATEDGADFDQLATDNNGKDYTFDSGDSSDSSKAQSLPPKDVQKVAFSQDKDSVSDVITSKANDGSEKYYIIKVTNKTDKNPDWKTYKNRLTDIYVNQKTSDSNFTNKVIANLLKEYNVTIEDQTYSTLLSNYGLDSSASSASSSKK